MINLRTIDLNLLTVFEAVYEERNMTRAAERLAMSQPAVSNAVGRLREALRDELFVADRRGARVTPAAARMYPTIKNSLDAVRGTLGEVFEFKPEESERLFVVSATYAPGAAFWKAALDWVGSVAPKIAVRLLALYSREEGIAALREGRADFMFDLSEPIVRDLESIALFRDELVVIASRDHPRIGGRISKREFLAERHAVHSSLMAPSNQVEIEGALGHRMLDVAMQVREPLELPFWVSQSDLIAVCNRRLVEPLEDMLKLRLLPLPYRAPPITSYLVWHATKQRDAGHRWLREGVARVVKTLTTSNALKF